MDKFNEFKKVILTDDLADDSCIVMIYTNSNKKLYGRLSYHKKEDVNELKKLRDLKNNPNVKVIDGWTDGYNNGDY